MLPCPAPPLPSFATPSLRDSHRRLLAPCQRSASVHHTARVDVSGLDAHHEAPALTLSRTRLGPNPERMDGMERPRTIHVVVEQPTTQDRFSNYLQFTTTVPPAIRCQLSAVS